MVKSLLKNVWFMSGFLFIVLLFAASIIHTVFFDEYIPNMKLLMKDGNLIAASPLSPLQYPPFGTNKQGDSLLFKILQGAKYTIGTAILVAFLRMLFSVIIGLFYGNYLMRINRYVSKVVEAFHYLPVALLAFMLLNQVLNEKAAIGQFQYSFSERVIFEITIMTAIALPTTILLIGNETNQVLKQEFITGAKLMGASRLHIIRKHVLPHLMPRLFTQFLQQIIQVLVLLVHLGVLKLFFAGTHITVGPFGPTFSSVSGEWSGIVGNSYQYLQATPWVPLVPLVMFALTILALNFTLEGLKKSLTEVPVNRRKEGKENSVSTRTPDNPSFEFLHS